MGPVRRFVLIGFAFTNIECGFLHKGFQSTA